MKANTVDPDRENISIEEILKLPTVSQEFEEQTRAASGKPIVGSRIPNSLHATLGPLKFPKDTKANVLFFSNEVVRHIRQNWHEYEPFVVAEWNIADRDEYCDYMSTVGTFASELECTVATKIYYMNLSIYREIHQTRELKRVFHNHVSSQYETARLLFTGNSNSGHYNLLFPD